MTDHEWLNGLQAGDEVAISYGYRGDEYKIHTIDRTTKTRLVIGALSYRKNDGGLVGGDHWSKSYIEKPTDNIRAKIKADDRRGRAIRVIREAKLDHHSTLSNMPIERLEAIASAIHPEDCMLK